MIIRPVIRALIATFAAASLLAASLVAVAAQGATPTPVSSEQPSYPVSIHAGTCDDLTAQPIGPTLDTEIAGLDGGERAGISDEGPILVASGTVERSMDDLTGTPHVVAVHASPADYGTVVACGEVAGYVDDGRLVFALRGVDGSDVAGIAIFDDNPSFLDEVFQEIDLDLDLDLGSHKLSLTVLVIPAEEVTGA